ncbi:hypothetical protein ACQVPJ_17410 [Bacillus mycoides]|uniref:hypothetical protein n=1 Tax=Bacillus mycoides TaxID=1405 RepID=UPI003D65AAB2
MNKMKVESRLEKWAEKQKEINVPLNGSRQNKKRKNSSSNKIRKRITDNIYLFIYFIIVLIPFILSVAFVGWILYAIFWPEDSYEKYYEDHDNNPYNQDWNGDGWKGTKEDHDVYHKIK